MPRHGPAVEQIAMRAVMNAERALGRDVIDVSAEKCGDVTICQRRWTAAPPSRHIEVKGAKGQTTITVTKNEILYGTQPDRQVHSAIVMVGR